MITTWTCAASAPMRLFVVVALRAVGTYPSNTYMRVVHKCYRESGRSNGFSGKAHISKLPDINLPKRSWLGTPCRSLCAIGEHEKDDN